MTQLYMIAVQYADDYSLMGVADSLEAAQAHVLQRCQQEFPEEPVAAGELDWDLTPLDNFEHLRWTALWEGMHFVIKTATLIKETI